ncbi:hypothetical protein BLNAU_19012 [Blattamonas nauphoetae]|uniref:Uncharacterized protein n=1 Tax=Blattamonas nauphoetae TaxID=2049346 RepID=A0ABQ9X371_9EUKA|nr:hypothetical protein BLNAU_19012 [Blattamonas nauphoetae]
MDPNTNLGFDSNPSVFGSPGAATFDVTTSTTYVATPGYTMNVGAPNVQMNVGAPNVQMNMAVPNMSMTVTAPQVEGGIAPTMKLDYEAPTAAVPQQNIYMQAPDMNMPVQTMAITGPPMEANAQISFPASTEASGMMNNAPPQAYGTYQPVPAMPVPIATVQGEDEEMKPVKRKHYQTHKDFVQIQEGVYHTPERYCGGACETDCYPASLIFMVFFWAGLAMLAVGIILRVTALLIAGAAVSGFFYLANIIESCCGRHFKYLTHLNDSDSFIDIVYGMRNSAPRIWWTCECYHYETRVRYVNETYTDSNGQQRTRQRRETYEEKVVTSSGIQDLHMKRWEDVSGNLTEAVYLFNAIRVDFTKEYHYADSKSQRHAMEQKELFLLQYRFRDSHFDWWEHFEIPGFRTNMMCMVDPKKKPKAMNAGLYVLCILLTVPFIYRRWIDKKSVSAKFHVCKSLYV